MSKLLPVLLLSLVLLSSCSAKPETESIEPTELPVFEVTTPEPTPTVPLWSEEEVDVLAKMVWGEARGVPSDTEKGRLCVVCAQPCRSRIWFNHYGSYRSLSIHRV